MKTVRLICNHLTINQKLLVHDYEDLLRHFPSLGQYNIDQIIVSGRPVEKFFLEQYLNDRASRSIDIHIRSEGLVTIGIITGALIIGSILLAPSVGTGLEQTRSNPNENISFSTNAQRQGQQFVEAFGFNRICPDFAQRPYFKYIEGKKVISEFFTVGVGHYDDKIGFIGNLQIEDDTPNTVLKFYEPNQEIDVPLVKTNFAPTLQDQTLEGENEPQITYQSKVKLNIDTANSQTKITFTDDEKFESFELPSSLAKVYINLFYKEGESPPTLVINFKGNFNVIQVDIENKFIVVDGLPTVTGSTGTEFENIDATIQKLAADGSSLVWAGWGQIEGKDHDKIFVNLSFPRGLMNKDSKADEVQYRIQLRNIDNTIPVDSGIITVNRKSSTPFGITHEFNGLGPGRVQVRIKRIDDFIENAANTLHLDSVFGQTAYNQTFDETMVSLQRRASFDDSLDKSSKFFVECVRMLPAYDRNAGTFGALTRTRSFADALVYTLITRDQTPQEEVSLDALYEIADRLPDELQRYDGIFSNASDKVGDRVNSILDNCRVLLSRDFGFYDFVRDDGSNTDVEYLVTVQQMMTGNGLIQYPERGANANDGAQVEYLDDESNKATYNLDMDFNLVETRNPVKIKLKGGRGEAIAKDRAEFEIRKLLYPPKVFQINTHRGAVIPRGKNLIVADNYDPDIATGEVLSVNGNILELSEPMPNISGALIRVANKMGRPSQAVAVTRASEDGYQVYIQDIGLASNFLHVSDDVHQFGSGFIIANKTDMDASIYTVTDIKPSGDDTVKITAQQFDELRYT